MKFVMTKGKFLQLLRFERLNKDHTDEEDPNELSTQ